MDRSDLHSLWIHFYYRDREEMVDRSQWFYDIFSQLCMSGFCDGKRDERILVYECFYHKNFII